MKEKTSKAQFKERVFVATPMSRAIGIDRIQALIEEQLRNFNEKSVPLLKSHGLFFSTEPKDYVGYDLQKAVGELLVSRAQGMNFESDVERQLFVVNESSRFIRELQSLVPFPCADERYLAAMEYDESRGGFFLNHQKLEENFAIYAEDSESIRVYRKLEELVNLWNSFKHSKNVNLTSFVNSPDFLTGEISIKGVMRRDEWEEFVNIQG